LRHDDGEARGPVVIGATCVVRARQASRSAAALQRRHLAAVEAGARRALALALVALAAVGLCVVLHTGTQASWAAAGP
jgi:hypothetical protein